MLAFHVVQVYIFFYLKLRVVMSAIFGTYAQRQSLKTNLKYFFKLANEPSWKNEIKYFEACADDVTTTNMCKSYCILLVFCTITIFYTHIISTKIKTISQTRLG